MLFVNAIFANKGTTTPSPDGTTTRWDTAFAGAICEHDFCKYRELQHMEHPELIKEQQHENFFCILDLVMELKHSRVAHFKLK